MSFRFNFGEFDQNETFECYKSPHHVEDNESQSNAKEIELKLTHVDMLQSMNLFDCVKVCGIELKHVNAKSLEERLRAENSLILSSIHSAHSDLIPGVYEGGFKIWECTLDLLGYFLDQKILFKGLKVLEIGCGTGLPGIFAYLRGADVAFQDYNSEVLDHVTIPNLLLNANSEKKEDMESRCLFVSGDWVKVSSLLLRKYPEKFDIILTSETIYSLESQSKLLNLMKEVLKKSGTIYLAAKTFYFGVGGGTREFEELIERDGQLKSEVCQIIETGVRREILQLKFK